MTRTFLVRAPRHARGEKLPVIMALHGAGGNSESFQRLTGFTADVAKQRFIAVYPQGTPLSGNLRAWNAGTCCGSPVVKNIDDIAYLSAVIRSVVAHDSADPQRIYLAGFSNGGMLAYRAACDIGESIAGIAVVSGALNVPSCTSTNRMPVLIIHGTADPIVPFDGGLSSAVKKYGLEPWQNASVADAVAAWRARDGCSGEPRTTTRGTLRESLYTDCGTGAFIDERVLTGGGHTWPDGTASLIEDEFLDHTAQ